MSNSAPISYLILKSSEDELGKKVLLQDEDEILENLVQKYQIGNEIKWNEIVKEYTLMTSIGATVDELMRKWKILQEMKNSMVIPPYQVNIYW